MSSQTLGIFSLYVYFVENVKTYLIVELEFHSSLHFVILLSCYITKSLYSGNQTIIFREKWTI